MKTKILICLLFFALTMQAQSQEKKSKSEQWLVLVNGNCEMCKARIEKAALQTKGTKYASWDLHSKTLKLIFNPYKTSKETLAKSIFVRPSSLCNIDKLASRINLIETLVSISDCFM